MPPAFNRKAEGWRHIFHDHGVATSYRQGSFRGVLHHGGINHFTNAGMMSGYARSKNVPGAYLAVVGTGVILVLGGITVLLGLFP